MGLNKPLLADKLVVSLMGVEREEDATHSFPPFSKISMEKNSLMLLRQLIA